MKVTWTWNNMRDAGEGNLGKMFGSAFHTLGRESETLGGMDDAKHRCAGRACASEQANPADRELQPVIVGDRRQTGSRAISFVALADSSHCHT
jgi:hypothetical protein